MPVGSIGPTRGRCLAKLRDVLAGDPHWEGRDCDGRRPHRRRARLEERPPGRLDDDRRGAARARSRSCSTTSTRCPTTWCDRIQFSLALDEIYAEVAAMTRMPETRSRCAATRPAHAHRDADLLGGAAHRDGHGEPRRAGRLRIDGWVAPAGGVPGPAADAGRGPRGGRPTTRAGSSSRACPRASRQLSFHPLGDRDAGPGRTRRERGRHARCSSCEGPGRGGATRPPGPATRSAARGRGRPRALSQRGRPVRRARRPGAAQSDRARRRRAAVEVGAQHVRVMLGLAAADFEVTGDLEAALALLADAERVALAGGPGAAGLRPRPARAAAAARRPTTGGAAAPSTPRRGASRDAEPYDRDRDPAQPGGAAPRASVRSTSADRTSRVRAGSPGPPTTAC